MIKKHQQKIDNVNNNNNNRTLIIGSSNCGKTYLMNHILHQKQEPVFTNAESLKQYLNVKAQTSDKIQLLEKIENSIVVFDDILLSEQQNIIDLFFTRARYQNIDIYYIYQNYFNLPKDSIRDNSIISILHKQTLRDIIFLFHVIAGLDMN